jgi:hypothetical protein
MAVSRAQVRRAGVLACIVLTASAGLGLLGPQAADASCAGPQFDLQQDGTAVPRERANADSELVYTVVRDEPLRVLGSNMTYTCNDTGSFTHPGCGPAVRTPDEPIVPLDDVELRISQRGRSAVLAVADPSPADLTVVYDLQRLPAFLRRGPARLSWAPRGEQGGAQLDLLLT